MRYNYLREIIGMEKTTTLNLRVNPEVKKNAEEILSKLGMSMSTAIDIYLRQISLNQGIPFLIAIPSAPTSINTDEMTAQEIRALIQEGLDDINAGKVQDASAAFAKFRESL